MEDSSPFVKPDCSNIICCPARNTDPDQNPPLTAIKAGRQAGGHEAKLFVTSQMNFDPILHEGFGRVQPLEPDLRGPRAAHAEAQHSCFCRWPARSGRQSTA
jgi:hypothetical protein